MCLCGSGLMNGREFVRRVRRYARKNRLEFDFNPSRGKGSHSKLTIGSRSVTVQHGEIASGTLAAMLKQLNINREDI